MQGTQCCGKSWNKMFRNKGTRYGARMLCVADFAKGNPMDRTEIDIEDCLNAISEMYEPEDQTLRWLVNQIGKDHVGIGKEDIKDELFDPKFALHEYEFQKREILAAAALKKEAEAENLDLFGLAKELGIYPWTLIGWTTLQRKIPWYLVLGIENAQKYGNWTVKGVILRWMAKRERQKEFLKEKNEKKEN